MRLNIKKLTSLDKVFINEEPKASNGRVESIFRNEVYSFQIAYCCEYDEGIELNTVKVNIESDFPGEIRLMNVGNVPSELPAYPGCDQDYITEKPGLFPDPLYEMDSFELKIIPHQWRSIWVELQPNETATGGTYRTHIGFLSSDGIEIAAAEETITILDVFLPEQELIYTEWMHYDCIGVYYGTEMLGEAHWKLIEHYVRTAVEHGVNMLLTPVFTPPLDTKIGGERPTIQLVDIKLENETYLFDFSKLKRFVDMCRRVGIKYFEISHLFTQWGAYSTPKIIAEVEGVRKRIFGWETNADEPRYRRFLDCFLPELTKVLKKWGIADRCLFHVSDEPNINQLESYRTAHGIIEKHLKGFKIIDALSDYDFYKEGIVKNPIPSSDHISQFLDNKVKDLWVYYCCAQVKDVSNRFMAMPSRRNRVIATQFYKFKIMGFLHWGFNFWNSQLSIKPVNPYAITDAGCAFPSGDAFLVYPGEDGKPVESIRLKVFREALYDLRAMKMLEKLTSREFVMKIIEGKLEKPITFSEYPRDDQFIFSMRNRINYEIKKRL